MKIEQLEEIVARVKTIQKLQEEVYQLASSYDELDADIRLCETSLRSYPVTLSMHMYTGLEKLAEQLGVPQSAIISTERGTDTDYPIEKAFVFNGVRYFKLYTNK